MRVENATTARLCDFAVAVDDKCEDAMELILECVCLWFLFLLIFLFQNGEEGREKGGREEGEKKERKKEGREGGRQKEKGSDREREGERKKLKALKIK